MIPEENEAPHFRMPGDFPFEENEAIINIEKFEKFLWEGTRKPLELYITKSGLPTILTLVEDGTYDEAIESVESMESLIEYLSFESDRAANMDW